jgi:type IV pilus assembly protein PilC
LTDEKRPGKALCLGSFLFLFDAQVSPGIGGTLLLRFGRLVVGLKDSQLLESLEDRFVRVSQQDMVVFFTQFSILFNAGIPILRAFTIISRQTANGKLARIISRARRDIERGETISGALSRFPEVFSTLECAALRTGECAGDMGAILKKLAAFRRRDLELSQRVKNAMTYPLMVFAAALVVIFFLTQFLFDNILPIVRNQGLELSFVTKVLLALYLFCRNPFVIVFLLVLGAAMWPALRALYHSPSLKTMRDRMLWRLPVAGPTLKKIALARFCFDVSFLYENGISLLKILPMVAESSGHSIIERGLQESLELIKQGEPFWKSLQRNGVFPDSLVQMIKVGEVSGTISQCLTRLADIYEMEVELSVENCARALEPIMISFMGIFVGLIIFITLSPLYRLIASFEF